MTATRFTPRTSPTGGDRGAATAMRGAAGYDGLACRICLAVGASAAATDPDLVLRWVVDNGSILPVPPSGPLAAVVSPADGDVLADLAARARRAGGADGVGPSGRTYHVIATPEVDPTLVWIWREPHARPSASVAGPLEDRLATFVAELRDLGIADDVPAGLGALPGASALSARERSIVAAVLAGRRTSTIAREFDLSDSTVRSHLSAAFTKLGVRSQVDLIERFRTR